MIPRNVDPGYVSVRCVKCDDVVFVPLGWVISRPYICTVCQKRAMRKLENATNPWAGRMQHGASLKGGE